MKIKETDQHHRRQRSMGGDDSQPNISVVDRRQHEAWHTLFDGMLPDEIAKSINLVWLDPSYKFVVEHK